MLKRLLTSTAIAALAVIGFWAFTQPQPQPALPPLTNNAGSDTRGFARALTPIEFEFPRDHGPHFDYQTEWWYYTGNLQAETGEHFGYQLTFFRRGLTPEMPVDDAGFLTNQIYFAHFGLTDVVGGVHRGVERFSRGAAGLAGAGSEPFRAWLEDWRVDSLNTDGSHVRLVAQEDNRALDLTLRAVKPIVAHGDRGLSAKSEQPGNASYYLSFTRMQTEGTITVRGQTFTVTGESWFDHEWSTSVLGPNAVGWDWFSLQLSDGREVMLYFLRLKDGGLEPVSGGTLVLPDGATQSLGVNEVTVRAQREWLSPVSGARYPIDWQVSVPSAQLELRVEPWLDAQEMQLNFEYWEGAVKVSGTSNGAPVTGNGYVELTGYRDSMQGVLGGQ
ncbi:MAG: lipocalin-like domain-containing protein [Anaerolineales bacterium]